jgi:hypothetical protein
MIDQITPEIIIQTVADYFKTPIEKVLSTSRNKEFVKVRHIAMYLIRKHIKHLILFEICKYFPGKVKYKSHAQILNAIKKVNNYIDTDKSYKTDIENLEIKLGTNLIHIPTEQDIKSEILFFENKHLRNEVLNLKCEITKLQGVIYGLKQSNKKFSKRFLQRQLNN